MSSDLEISYLDDEQPIIQPRSREVWLSDDQKVINRTVRLFLSRGISIDMYCTNPECSDNKITREANASGFDLLCGCKRRVFGRPTQSDPRAFVSRQ